MTPPVARWLPLLLLGAALTQPAAGGPPPPADGRAVYNFHCYFCHGYSGDAATLAATYLDPPPRNFRATSPDALPRAAMVEAVRHGRAGTAMQGFGARLSGAEIDAVVDFVRDEFLLGDRDNTRYHTVDNGWPDHRRYAKAYPFATGQLPLDTPWELLDEAQADGKRLFLGSCISCHDRATVTEEGPAWESRPLSYPRAGYSHRPPRRVDAASGASPFAIHERERPLPAGASAAVRAGARLFRENCAFCHAADGTGRNWIGQFVEPHARDLTDPAVMAGMTAERLRHTLREGLPNTTMPAWKGVLSEQQIESLIRYIDALFHPLAGAGGDTG